MNDKHPFEHQLFKVISQDVPFLKELIIHNVVPPQNKQCSSSLITFPHLILLNLIEAHVDYAEQFLVDKNTHLPCLLDLYIKYESLAMVTNNFINDAKRLTCAQLKRLHMDNLFVRPKNFDKYKYLLEIFLIKESKFVRVKYNRISSDEIIIIRKENILCSIETIYMYIKTLTNIRLLYYIRIEMCVLCLHLFF
jgi:hypothetical protein